MARRRLRRGDYDVGWVCALPVELAAAQALLDEEHERLGQDVNDTNLYTLGRIGQHNVVIACLPAGQTGTNSAAAVAVQMKSTFKSIQFGLMVGIGGGVPSAEADIRLGDVVISQPHKGHGGVVQYDSGKTTPSGFERTGFLNAPPTILLNAVSKIRANHFIERGSLLEHISKLSNRPVFARDNAGSDVLFEASYNHVGGATCDLCSKERVVERQPRGNQIVAHYGTIASGNQVMRDGATRDRISLEFGGVLCFEMEAAGLINSFPWLVIRGICDYADSHKNKKWQAYAAATAAAYAKEVLSVIPSEGDIQAERNRDNKPLFSDSLLTAGHWGSMMLTSLAVGIAGSTINTHYTTRSPHSIPVEHGCKKKFPSLFSRTECSTPAHKTISPTLYTPSRSTKDYASDWFFCVSYL
jgi:nucleoside phosphorylase